MYMYTGRTSSVLQQDSFQAEEGHVVYDPPPRIDLQPDAGLTARTDETRQL